MTVQLDYGTNFCNNTIFIYITEILDKHVIKAIKSGTNTVLHKRQY